MTQPPPPLPRILTERPSRLEVVLPAVMWPGAGQFLQGRWLVSILFMTGGLITGGLLLREAVLPNITNVAILLEMDGHSANEPLRTVSIARILAFAGAFGVVYLISIADAARAYRRRLRAWQRLARELSAS